MILKRLQKKICSESSMSKFMKHKKLNMKRFSFSSVMSFLSSTDKNYSLIDVGCLTVLFMLGYAVWTYVFPEGYIPSGIDDSAHYFKVWFLSYSWHRYGMVPRWCNSWYGGYPILVFHGPLSYYAALILNIGLNSDPLHAYKIVYLMSYLLITYGCYFLVRELNGNPMQGFIGGLMIAFAPAILKNISLLGSYPSAVSFGLIPVCMASFIRLCNSRRFKIWFPITVLLASGVLLAHIAGFIFMEIMLAGWVIVFIRRKTIFLRILIKYVLVSLFSIIVCSWWLYPFLQYYTFSHPAFVRKFAASPLNMIKRSFWVEYLGIILLMVLPFALIRIFYYKGDAGNNKNKRESSLSMLIAFLLLLLGWGISYLIGESPNLSRVSVLQVFRLFDLSYFAMGIPLAVLWGVSYPYLPSPILYRVKKNPQSLSS